MSKIQQIRRTWTYNHIELVIIIGLVCGIAIESIGGAAAFTLPTSGTVTYTADPVAVCDLDCEIVERTQRIYKERHGEYMERARLQALEEMRGVLLEKAGESPYYDYAAMRKKYGY